MGSLVKRPDQKPKGPAEDGGCNTFKQRFYFARGGMSDSITTSVTTPAPNTEASMRGLLGAILSTPINQRAKMPTKSKELMNSVQLSLSSPQLARRMSLQLTRALGVKGREKRQSH
jgi:hypothetical protein